VFHRLQARIRELIDQERIPEARAMLQSALEQEVDSPFLLDLQKVLALPEAKRVPVTDVDRTAEMRWLAAQREQYLGQWVAVRGDSLLARAPSLKELLSALPSGEGQPAPLVHRMQ
jgi:hypothetical protein